MHPDQKYITALLENDSRLINEIYLKYSQKIIQMIVSNGGTELDVADIFQEGLIAIYRKASSGNFGLTCPFEAFLYLVCRKKWLNELQRRKGKKVIFKDIEEYNIIGESLQEAEICLLYHERRLLLEEKVEVLDDKCKHLVKLSWSSKSMKDVATALNMTYEYACKRKSKCIGKLIKLIKASSKFNSLKW